MVENKARARMMELVPQGLTHSQIADKLNSEKFKTKRGKPIDARWVATNLWLERRQGKRTGGAAVTTNLEMIKLIMSSDLSPSDKVEVLRMALKPEEQKKEPKSGSKKK